MMNVKPRLGRIPQGGERQGATYFFTANVCLRVKSEAALVKLQRMLDKRLGLQGGSPRQNFRYQRWTWNDEARQAESAKESRARNGVGRPPMRKIALRHLIEQDAAVAAEVESFKKRA